MSTEFLTPSRVNDLQEQVTFGYCNEIPYCMLQQTYDTWRMGAIGRNTTLLYTIQYVTVMYVVQCSYIYMYILMYMNMCVCLCIYKCMSMYRQVGILLQYRAEVQSILSCALAVFVYVCVQQAVQKSGAFSFNYSQTLIIYFIVPVIQRKKLHSNRNTRGVPRHFSFFMLCLITKYLPKKSTEAFAHTWLSTDRTNRAQKNSKQSHRYRQMQQFGRFMTEPILNRVIVIFKDNGWDVL